MKIIITIFTSIIVTILLGALIITACVPVQAVQTPAATVVVGEPVTAVGSTPLSEMTPEPTLTPTEDTGGQKVVTLDDQGKTLEITVGDNFLLQLGDGYTWDITISDESVISRVKNITVINGAQGVYDVLGAGTTTLTAVGDPVCRQSNPPCSIPSIQFIVTIVAK